jgi:uncharacterized protein (TIGR02118 family)
VEQLHPDQRRLLQALTRAMVWLVALYNMPEDTIAFDAHYRDVHMPIVRRYPALRALRTVHPRGLGDRPPAVYLIMEMGFDSRADLDAAVASEAGRDLRNFAQAGVTVTVVDDADRQTDG